MFTSKHILVTLLRLRPVVHRAYQPPEFRRHFSLTRRAHAAETPEPFGSLLKDTSLFRQLADKPEALQALTSFAKVLQEQGFDLSAGKPPSSMQVLRMATNPEFREAAKRVMDELQKAGVDVKSQEFMQELMSLRKPGNG